MIRFLDPTAGIYTISAYQLYCLLIYRRYTKHNGRIRKYFLEQKKYIKYWTSQGGLMTLIVFSHYIPSVYEQVVEHACRCGHTRILNIFMEKRFDHEPYFWKDMIHLATKGNHMDIVKLISNAMNFQPLSTKFIQILCRNE